MVIAKDLTRDLLYAKVNSLVRKLEKCCAAICTNDDQEEVVAVYNNRMFMR